MLEDELLVSIETMQRSEREHKLMRAKAEAFDALLEACEKLLKQEPGITFVGDRWNDFNLAVSAARAARGK